MKNIFLLPTDKPSRFWMTKLGNLTRCHDIRPIKEGLGNNVNIYITSDEEIKEGDWYFDCVANVINTSKTNGKYKIYKKIILTTDQSLDGVQAIDDEFLEWFVKNPSCEKVEVVEELKYFNLDELRERNIKGLPHIYSEKIGYKIIIPKEEQTKCYCGHTSYCDCGPEEPKQELPQFGTKEFNDLASQYFGGKPKQYSKYLSCCRSEEECYCKEELEEETLEEANWKVIGTIKNTFYNGAKWQQERSYSLDEIKTAMKNGYGIKYFSEHTFLKNLNNLKKK
jgi:hypothetical protein